MTIDKYAVLHGFAYVVDDGNMLDVFSVVVWRVHGGILVEVCTGPGFDGILAFELRRDFSPCNLVRSFDVSADNLAPSALLPALRAAFAEWDAAGLTDMGGACAVADDWVRSGWVDGLFLRESVGYLNTVLHDAISMSRAGSRGLCWFSKALV